MAKTYLITWGGGAERTNDVQEALKLAKRKSSGPFGASVYRTTQPGRGKLLYTCAKAVCVAFPKSALGGAKKRRRKFKRK